MTKSQPKVRKASTGKASAPTKASKTTKATKVTKATTVSRSAKTIETPKRAFERWLTSGSAVLVLALITTLIANLLIKSEGTLSGESNTITTIFITLTALFAFWWLVETARWIIIHIEKNATKKTKSK